MKCLIVQKHWLDKIFDEGKIWEMRSTKTKIRGKIGLIEAGSGLIVGEAYITRCVQKKISNNPIFIEFHKIEDLSLIDRWPYAWVIKNSRRYDEPIPYNHPRGAVIWVNT